MLPRVIMSNVTVVMGLMQDVSEAVLPGLTLILWVVSLLALIDGFIPHSDQII